jgi:hypothetical protein
MLKKIALALLTLCSLAAAAQGGPDRQAIDVRVVNGQAEVPEEEALTTAAQGALVWRLVTPGYRFADNGIVIMAEGKHRCGPIANGQRFRCIKLNHVRGERYKYDVNLVQISTGKPLPTLDPWIVND